MRPCAFSRSAWPLLLHSHYAAPILNGELQAASSTPLAGVSPLDYSQIITIEPGKRSGKPCIRGTRMTVYDVLGYMAAGMSHQEILADFPSLTETDLRACLAFAADGERAFEVVSI